MSGPYSALVMDHFMNPRNVGDLPDADGIGTITNPICGDMTQIFIKVAEGCIEDVRFKTFGCGAAIATGSMITELVKGKTLTEALDISNRTVARALGGLPPRKMHCSNLAADAFVAAINDYRAKQGQPPVTPPWARAAGDEGGEAEHGAPAAAKAALGASCTLRLNGKPQPASEG